MAVAALILAIGVLIGTPILMIVTGEIVACLILVIGLLVCHQGFAILVGHPGRTYLTTWSRIRAYQIGLAIGVPGVALVTWSWSLASLTLSDSWVGLLAVIIAAWRFAFWSARNPPSEISE